MIFNDAPDGDWTYPVHYDSLGIGGTEIVARWIGERLAEARQHEAANARRVFVTLLIAIAGGEVLGWAVLTAALVMG